MPEEKPETTSEATSEPKPAVAAPEQPEASRPEPPRISIGEFAKVEMRVGQILEASRIEGSRKLIQLRVDIGTEVRQVVAGIADAYTPDQLVGKKVILVVNLKPARLMGVESNGMVLAASDGGRAVLPAFGEDVPNGAPLR